MRITQCHIDAFGHFRDCTFDDLGHPVVTVLGPNEAGKTTFFHFLQTMLYGIYPVDADQHVYAPQDGRRLVGRLVLRNGEATFEVARRLLSTPHGRLRSGEREEGLRNHTVPIARHIPQSVFESVYALSLHDMAALGGKAWDAIQERLLGGLSIDFIHPAGDVVSALEEEANGLWRPDRRGKPRSKQLEGRLGELRTALREARDNDAQIRALHDQIIQHDERIRELEADKVHLRAERRRADRLIPVRTLLSKIEALRAEAGEVSMLGDLPDDPQVAREALDEQLQAATSALEANASAHATSRRTIEAYTPEDARIVEQATAIRAWSKKAAAHESLVTQIEQARRDVGASRTRLEQLASRILTEPWDDALVPPVRDLAEAELRQRVKQYEAAAGRLREAEAQARALELNTGQRRSLVPGVVAAGMGMILFGIGLWLGIPVVQFIAVTVIGFGGAQMYFSHQHNQEVGQRKVRLDIDGLRRAAEEHGAAVAELLHDLPLPESRTRQPDGDLTSDLQALRAEVGTYYTASRAVTALAQEMKTNQRTVMELAEGCGHLSTGAVSETIAELEQRLEDAEARRRDADAAEKELSQLQAESERLEEERDRAAEEKKHLEARLAQLGDGDVATGMEVLRRRREALAEADHHAATLRRDYPDWEELQAEIEVLEQERGTWAYTDEEIIRLEDEADAVENDLRSEEAARAAKQKEVETLRQQPTADAVASEIAYVEEQLLDLRQRRDRLMLLARIVAHADHRFRMKHQPGVIKHASRYLRIITDGRYERLLLDETDDTLKVIEAGASFPVPVSEPLSQGTRDQVYLALRLAIVDHLDEGQERLPLFLDEVFVHWDGTRRRLGLGILEEMARQRQVFVFTCHPWLADELERELGARRIALNVPAEGGMTA